MNKNEKRFTVSVSETENGGSTAETHHYASFDAALRFTIKRFESWAEGLGLVDGLEETDREDIRKHRSVRGTWLEDGAEPSEIWITIEDACEPKRSTGFADITFDVRDESQRRLEDEALAQEDCE